MAIYIDEKICKGCRICVLSCPRDIYRLSEKRNVKGYNVAEVVHPENCRACKLCEISCPDLAIYVESSIESEEE